MTNRQGDMNSGQWIVADGQGSRSFEAVHFDHCSPAPCLSDQ